MWADLIYSSFAGAVVGPPESPGALDEAARALGSRVPEDLASLLSECGGVKGALGVAAVWPLRQIVEVNNRFRTDAVLGSLYMPFDGLVFFGDDGGGDQFAFVDRQRRRDVFVWEHETDSRRWVSSSLERYLRQSLAGGDEWYRPE
ncbi:SMI1/KNR4 family protein [Antribacter gilvus]|uniref:SMI1/KNR4 family protein n=1 Tax=Antribacter gilvus TaxID=2304675 RepID=UPI000F76C6AD